MKICKRHCLFISKAYLTEQRIVLLSMSFSLHFCKTTPGSHKGPGRPLNGKLLRKQEVSNSNGSFEFLQALLSWTE